MPTCLTEKTIRITYSRPVTDGIRHLRVFPPPQRGSQRVLHLHWRCHPRLSASREYTDEFGNQVLELRHESMEREFCFEMTLETVRKDCAAARHEGLPSTGLGAFVLPSALCDLSPEVRKAAHHLFPDIRQARDDVELSAFQICQWVHQNLQYAPGATNPATTATQVLKRGKGVCQDYAHLMIALCRAVAIPSRYVSGYNPAEGLMHAWVEVLRGEQWQAWDPTHNRPTSPRCVFVACGRDYRDVEPLIGSYCGRSRARLEVRCQTIAR